MTMIEYALTFLGTPYSWGGNTPEQGLDCSGLVCEILKSADRIRSDDDFSAQQLYNEFSSFGRLSSISKNSLVFYGKSVNEITHVAFAIGDDQIIESAGEGRIETDKGFVRIRPINYREDLIGGIKL